MNQVFAMEKAKNAVEAKLILLEGYDIATGTCLHHEEEMRNRTKPVSAINPFGIIGFHKSNDASRVTRYSELMKIYARDKIKENFGLNFYEFLDLPRVRIREMIEVSRSLAKEENERMAVIRKELEEAKQNLDQAKPPQ